jgi:competence protein ComEC
MFKIRPVVKVLIPFSIGIVISVYYSLSLQSLVIIIFTLLCLYLLSSLIKSLKGLKSLLLFVIIMVFGWIKMSYDSRYVPLDDISNYISLGEPVSVKGTIVELPRVSSQSIRFILSVDTILVKNTPKPVTGDLYISSAIEKVENTVLLKLKYGARLCLSGELSTIRTARNPGEFDLKYYFSLLNIYARLFPDKIDTNSIIGQDKSRFHTLFVYPVRSEVTERIDRLIGGEEGKFLKGLVVGERSEISAEVKTSFINCGVMHILAVSGLHVAIVVLILLAIFQIIRLPDKWGMILTIVLLVYYIFLTGSAPSVSRSVIMAIVFLVGKLMERKTDMYNTLAVSALILLLIDSKQLFQPGFQLSYAAVASIVYLYPKIFKLKELLPEKITSNRLIYFILAALAVSVAAGIGTLPFTSIYFGKISIVGFIANIIVVPLSNIILALGMLSVALSFISFWVASIYAEITLWLTFIMLKIVEWFGSIGFASVNIRITILEGIIFYVATGIFLNVFKKERRGIAIISALVLSNIILYYFILFSDTDKILRLTAIDVGQGDAILIEYPDESNMLIDSGPRSIQSDAAIRFVLPYLAYRRIDHLDQVVISHPDADHLGGAPSLLRRIPINKILESGIDCRSNLCKEYIHLADSLQIKRETLSKGDMMIINSSRGYILSPGTNEFHGVSVNNSSIVIRIVYGNTSFILMGDAEQEVDEKMVERYGKWLVSDLLKVSHHGSNTGTTEDLLKYTSPSIAVISVGKQNKFGHPSPEILKRLELHSVIIKRTDYAGAIIIESDGKRLHIIGWR